MVGRQDWQSQKARCINGHLLEGDNIRQMGNKRRCKRCDALRSKRAREAQKRQAGGVSAPRPRPEPILLPHIPQAICAGSPEPLWDDRIEGEKESDRADRHAVALRICWNCPSRLACLEARGESFGVWGGQIFEPKLDRAGRLVAGRSA